MTRSRRTSNAGWPGVGVSGVSTWVTHLVPDDKNVLLPLQLHDDRLQAHHNVAIRLAPAVSIVELVVVSCLVVLWIFLLFGMSTRTKFKSQAGALASISSYVMPSQTPASSSSSDFHVFFSNGSIDPVCIVRCSVEVHTSSGVSPIFFLTSSGSALAYSHPLGERSESPPILPSTLYMLSPC